MSILRPNLGKLIKFYSHSNSELIHDIKRDISLELILEDSQKGLRDIPPAIPYYDAFWSRAKKHAYSQQDIEISLKEFFESNPKSRNKEKPYNRAKECFLRWYDEKRRWRNDEFTQNMQIYKSKNFLLGSNHPIQIQNKDFLSINLNEDNKRIIYASFSSKTMISSEGARIALWILKNSFPEINDHAFRFLDVLHSRSYGLIDYQFQGNEPELLRARYKEILRIYETEKQNLEQKRRAA